MARLNVGSLLEFLHQQIELGQITEDTEIQLQYQPNYPLKSGARGVATKAQVDSYEEVDRDEEGDDAEETPKVDPAENTVYLVAADGNEYGDRNAWEAAEENR